jgi:hypothetical protein
MGLSLTIAVAVGLVFSLHADPRRLLRAGAAPQAPFSEPVLLPLGTAVASPTKPAFRERLRQSLVVAADEFFEMGRFLILGALLAALMQTFVRQSDLLAVGQGPVLSVLVMTLMAVLLSICSTVDSFIALAFTGTFTSGGILAFLVYGPMVDIKSTLMFLRVFKPRVVLALVLLPLILTLVAAVLINYLQG